MKNRLTTPILLLAIAAVPLAAHAQGKIGVINLSAAIGSTAEGRKAIADLQNKYQPKKQELERMQQEIQSLQDQLNRQAATLNEDEQRRLGRELDSKQKLFKRAYDDMQTDSAADQDDAIRVLTQKMRRVIGEYAEQNGYILVIDDYQIPVYYYAKDIDLLADMVKRYDAAHPVAEAGTPSKPAAPPAAPAP